MDKVTIAQGVATKLFAAENSLDSALADTSALLGGMIEARKEMGLSSTVGDDVVAKVSEAIAALTTARTAVVAAHGDLEQIKLRVGIRTKMFGAIKSLASLNRDETVEESRAA